MKFQKVYAEAKEKKRAKEETKRQEELKIEKAKKKEEKQVFKEINNFHSETQFRLKNCGDEKIGKKNNLERKWKKKYSEHHQKII